MSASVPGVELIDLMIIDPSPSNPRKHFDAGEVAELAVDLATRGLLQFPIVRPVGDRYELVIGEKRWRAACEAELGRIPCSVREMSDQEVLEAQIVENAKRSDVSAIEEADAYHALIERHGYTVESVAAKVGKSRSSVYQRLQLRHLGDVARKLLDEGRLPASHAVLVARIPEGKKLQDEAAKRIARRPGDDPMGFRDARELVGRLYMLRLKEAPWSLDDAELVAKAGPCTTCPRRTGNQSELFEDVASPNVCTDPACFELKRAAFAKRRAAELQKAGAVKLKAGEAKKITGTTWDGGVNLRYDAPYFKLDDTCHDDPKRRTYRKLLKPTDEDLVVAQVGGHLLELVPKKGLAAKLKAAGVTKPAPPKLQAPSAAVVAARRSGAAREALKAETKRRALAELRTSACDVWSGADVPLPVLRHLADSFLRAADPWPIEPLLLARGLSVPKKGSGEKELRRWIDGASTRDLVGLIAETCCCDEYSYAGVGDFDRTCAVFEVDLVAIEKAVKADAKKLEPKKAPTKAKRAKKKAAKKGRGKKETPST